MVIATCRGNLVNNTMRVTCIMFHKIVAKSISDHRNPYNMGVLSNNDIKDRDMVALTKRILEHSQKGEIDYARRIYDQMNHRDCVSCNVMIRGYIKNHRTRDAREIFDRMHHRNTVSWNSMIMAYTHERKMHIALKFFLIMPDKDVISWTTIISGLCHDSQIEDAWQLFKQMPEPNSISWSSVISGFQQNGLAAETLILFKEMLSAGIHPTPHSFTSALTATADLAALSIGQQLYSQLIKRGFEINIHVGNSAISMFIKSGSFYDARHVFVVIPRPDTITWNSMLSGYAQHGYGLEAIMTFHQMQKAHIFPDGDSKRVILELPDPLLNGNFPEEEMQIMAYLAKECLLHFSLSLF
ncbi:PREDICTED: pentatricopeptide repeat-containing protein At4g02750-like isoform X2 [Nelumbo nucifera]|uniref:Pentatricopeptide repeat-containing protein At4g02750-like isoform X2 n=1 Tax=Nelumbo nucifera TaxID=4432 RepID=A0A1U8Q6F8_NELNU|nr:PREDICTED: pentatricopeptide repeat-containing protein At4g02750-like isoform X2 [Nelumbo nucifera]XP_019054172.1 PREDICTED: pentatricopeptide repeat-containing protein At4g02750-like isoform X2 [Nelumbo nucifera]